MDIFVETSIKPIELVIFDNVESNGTLSNGDNAKETMVKLKRKHTIEQDDIDVIKNSLNASCLYRYLNYNIAVHQLNKQTNLSQITSTTLAIYFPITHTPTYVFN